MRFDRHAEVSGGKSDKSTNVTPRETPKTFILPECKPDGDDERVHQDDVRDRRGEVRTDSMVAGAAQVLREGKPWTL